MCRSITGFTLLETLIVLFLMGVAASISVPGYQFLVKKHRNLMVERQLLRAIRYARHQAVNYQQRVTIQGVPSWSGAYQVSTASKMLKQFPSYIKRGRLQWKGFPNYPYLQFTPLGFTHHQNGTFSFYLDDQLQWRLIINQAGRVRVG